LEVLTVIVKLITSEHFAIEFESQAEFQKEYEQNILAGGLCFHTATQLSEFTVIQLSLQMTGGGQLDIPATMVRAMGNALAVAFDTKPELIWSTLTTKPDSDKPSTVQTEQNIWERVRNLSRVEKLILAAKADRVERQVLLQDNDAQVVVIRIARSPLLSSISADTIAKTTIWAGNAEIRAALVHNAKTPTPLALKLLPTLPEPEIRQIAKSSAVSQALKQAALRIVISRQ
jgi:hypothetical protein